MDTELPYQGLLAALPGQTPLGAVLLVLGIITSLLAALAAFATVNARVARTISREEAARGMWAVLTALVVSVALLFFANDGLGLLKSDLRAETALLVLYMLALAALPPALGMGMGVLRAGRGEPGGLFMEAGLLVTAFFTFWLPHARPRPGHNGGNGHEEEPEFEITMASGEEVEAEEREYIENILEMGETVAREVMRPRTDVEAVDVAWPPERVLAYIADSRYSRFPVYENTIDNIIGILHLRDVLEFLARGEGISGLDLHAILMEPHFIPEIRKVDDVLRDLQRHKGHMAVVLDEYGGTAGILTIEDLLEEIVGEIQDEYDDESKEAHQREDGSWVVAAHMSLDNFNEVIGTALKAEDVDTLGGYITSLMGRIPKVRETVEVEDLGLRLTVLSIDRNRIRRVLVERASA